MFVYRRERPRRDESRNLCGASCNSKFNWYRFKERPKCSIWSHLQDLYLTSTFLPLKHYKFFSTVWIYVFNRLLLKKKGTFVMASIGQLENRKVLEMNFIRNISKLGPIWKPLISKHWQRDTILSTLYSYPR